MRLLKCILFLALGLAGWGLAPAARAQVRPYVGFAYPAGGQQGTTFKVRLGGQGLDGVNDVLVTGTGVTARLVEYHRRLNNQELQLLKEQLKELKQTNSAVAPMMTPSMMPDIMDEKSSESASEKEGLIARIENRMDEFVQTPASAAISSLAFVEVKIAPDAQPGEREIRLVTLRGVSNPLVFQIGQAPEFTRKPMFISSKQVLGKEAQALRNRPADEVEDRITIPCTVNGQIASSEENRYRFVARKGQRLVFATQGRALIPFIADAVPGWFQPVLTLYDAQGKEVAYDDDYRFMPDPVLFYQVSKDGEYVLSIRDAIYRGREDFVYRITIGELPFVTSIFPLGGKTGVEMTVRMKGWNLDETLIRPATNGVSSGSHILATSGKGFVSNRVPFELDSLPEAFEREPNNDLSHAQKVKLPLIINGRIGKPGDWDVYQFAGKSNHTVVAEVDARRLASPLDSVLKLTDAEGHLLAFNDDHEDFEAGVNTHDADSYLMVQLPADGTYFVHVGDTACHGGEEYAYRLRISAPQPDFALRMVPSSISLRSKASAAVSIQAVRKDGFAGPIKLSLKDPPEGFPSSLVTLSATQTTARLNLKTTLTETKGPIRLSVVGIAKIRGEEIVHEAVPAEDRMQAFLWRHLVPAKDFQVLVFDPTNNPPPRRVPPARPMTMADTNSTVATNTAVVSNAIVTTNNMAVVTTNGMTNATGSAVSPAKPKFTQQQIVGRLKQLKLLYEEDLLTDDFYDEKVAECEAAR
jgi:hypothetical protein